MGNVNVFVNGYGAPKDPLSDGNLCGYMCAISEYMDLHHDDVFTLYLAGGITNRKDMTEARAMKVWFDAHGLPANVTEVVLIEESTTARDNVALYSRKVDQGKPSVFFFEYSRRLQMIFLVKQYFNRHFHRLYKFCGVKFDEPSMELRNRLKQYFLRFPLEVLSWYLPSVREKISKPLRARHIARARQDYNKS